MKRNQLKSLQGFSLIELLVVSTIIIVLMGIAVVGYGRTARSSRDARRMADLEAVRQALVLRRSEVGNYATTTTGYTALGSTVQDYLSGPLPTNPRGAAYSGSVSPAEFCLCAELESDSPRGNASAADCSICTTNCGFYCVSNP